LSAFLTMGLKDVFSLELGFVNEEMMTISTQNVLSSTGWLDQILYPIR